MPKKLPTLFINLMLPAHVMAFNINAEDKTNIENLIDSRSCNELYLQVSDLEKLTYQHQQNYYTDKNAQAAGIASAVFTPAFIYFGYAAYKDFEAHSDTSSTMQGIDVIRMRMAEKRCFDR